MNDPATADHAAPDDTATTQETGSSSSSPRPRHQSQWTPLARALSAIGDHWTLSIVLQLAQENRRRVQLQRQLQGISSGVLDRHLQQMIALGLLSRKRFKEMPPRVELQLTAAGRELLPIAGALARWGARHMWSTPEAREQVDVEALLRLLPVLLQDAQDLPDGMLELIVQDGKQRDVTSAASSSTPPSSSHRFGIKQGRLQALEQSQLAKPGASVVGDTDAWVTALGPMRDYGKLRISGRKTLAKRVLDALPLEALSDEERDS